MINPKYPEIYVGLAGTDGNAFAVIARVCLALRRAGIDRKEIASFTTEVTTGDYDHVLTTAMRWVNVD